MKALIIINALSQNREVFKSLFLGANKEKFLWKPQPSKWCLLEILCHLYDEEREDFRARVRHVLDRPESSMTPINPEAWVIERNYIDKNYDEMLNLFLSERNKSLDWLKSLKNPKWDNTYNHPKLGYLSAGFFMENWLTHDYLHIRQINRLNYAYLQSNSDNDLSYAGNW